MTTETPELDHTDEADHTKAVAPDEVLADELVEDVSIDGMCGVY